MGKTERSKKPVGKKPSAPLFGAPTIGVTAIVAAAMLAWWGAAETHAQRPGVATPNKAATTLVGRPLPSNQVRAIELAQKNLRARAPSTLRASAVRATANTTLPVYLERMRAVWRAADKNQDWSLGWQGASPVEPLPATVAGCAVVQYEFVPAKQEKDPSNPGMWINTPAHYMPNGWSTYGEVLAVTLTPTNQCEAYGLEVTPVCTINGKDYTSKENFNSTPFGIPGVGGCGTYLGAGNPFCTKDTFKEWCAAHNGLYGERTKINGCESFMKLGPDSLESFLEVAKLNFAAEDHDKNGVVTPQENQFLCQP